MDKIREIAGDGALIQRFDDGMANMAEPIRVMAESLVNEIMDARPTRRAITATGATATASASSSPASAPSTSGSRSSAPAATSPRRGPHRAVLARGAGHGHRPHERQPGVEDVLVAGRVGRRLNLNLNLNLPRFHLHSTKPPSRRPSGSSPRTPRGSGSRARNASSPCCRGTLCTRISRSRPAPGCRTCAHGRTRP